MQIECSPNGGQKQFLAQKVEFVGQFVGLGGDGVVVEAVDEGVKERNGFRGGEGVGRESRFDGLAIEVFENGEAGIGDLDEGNGADGEVGILGVKELRFLVVDGDLGAGNEVVVDVWIADLFEVDAAGVGVSQVVGGGEGDEVAVGAEVEAGCGGELLGDGLLVEGEVVEWGFHVLEEILICPIQ